MQVKNQSFIHFLLACVISLSALAVLFTGISSYFRETDPDIAYAINPFNDDARVEYILEGLFRMRPEDSAPHMQEFREAAEQHVRLAPADARGYSLLAETHYRTGDEGLARSLFDKALHYSKTEIHALQRSFEFLARDGDFAAAMERIDLISRRWPSRFQLIAPHLAQMLQSPEAYEKAREL